MSRKRQHSMAQISAALLDAQRFPQEETHFSRDRTRQFATRTVSTQSLSSIGPYSDLGGTPTAPEPYAPGHLTKEQRKIFDAQASLLGEEEATRLQREAEERAKQEQEITRRTWATIQGIGSDLKTSLKRADISIGRIPTIGGIMLPLLALLVLFFLLIQVNGHTRLDWLWLVMIGDAYASGNVKTGSEPFQAKGGGQPTGDQPTVFIPSLTLSPNGMTAPF